MAAGTNDISQQAAKWQRHGFCAAQHPCMLESNWDCVACLYILLSSALKVVASHGAQLSHMGDMSMLMYRRLSSITFVMQQAAAQASGFRFSGSPGDCRHAWHHHHVPRHGLQRSHEQQTKQRIGRTADCFQLCGNQRCAQAGCYLQTVVYWKNEIENAAEV